MKIAILSPSKSVVGGVERFCAMLKKTFEEDGHVAEVLSPQPPRLLMSIFSKIGLVAPYTGFVLGREVLRGEYDVIVTNGLLGWNIQNKKIINVQHGTFAGAADNIDKGRSPFKWFMKKYIWGFFEMRCAQHASVVVAVSEQTALFVKKYYSVDIVHVIPNAVDFDFFVKKDKIASREKFSLDQNKKLALFVGRFEYGKGSDLMNRLLPEMIERNYNLVVASNSVVDIPGVISLVDVSYTDLPELYSASDLFLFPSRHEGCSFALLEAIACEVPFFATRVGSIVDLLKRDPDFSTWTFTIADFEHSTFRTIVERIENVQLQKRERVIAEQVFSYPFFHQEYVNLLTKLKK